MQRWVLKTPCQDQDSKHYYMLVLLVSGDDWTSLEEKLKSENLGTWFS